MSSWLQRIADASSFDNIGNVGELRRRLNDVKQAASIAESTLIDASPTPPNFHADREILMRVAGYVTRLSANSSSRVSTAVGRWRHLHNNAFTDDLVAGLTVALVAIPQSLAYAQLAGVPAYFGLYAAFVPTIVGALFGSSPQLSTGPTAMSSLLTAASIAPLAAVGSPTFVTDVVLLSLIAGVFQILFGTLRLGVLLSFLSHPVLMGFINAAALIIGMSQLPALLGIPSQQSEHLLVDVWYSLTNLPAASGLSIAFGVSAIAMLAAFKRVAPKLPGVLITMALLTGVSAWIGYADGGGAVVGPIPTGMPPFELPTGNWETVATLVPAGFVIALISFMEAMSSAKMIAIRTRQRWNQNRELIGQGLAKVAAAFSHTMPVSGSFSRSALNAGARTNISSVIAALAVLLMLLFFTSLIYHVPKSVLAAIIMIAVVGLIDLRAFVNAWLANRDDGLAAIATFIATLGFAPFIQNGIIAGTLLSLGLLLYRMMRPRVAILGLHTDGKLRDVRRIDVAPLQPRLGAIRFDGSLHFVTSSYFDNALTLLEQNNPNLRFILIQASGINDLDSTGVEVLRNLGERFRKNGIILVFSALKQQVREVLDRTNLTEQIGAENIFATDELALDELNRRLAEPMSAKAAFEEGKSCTTKPTEDNQSLSAAHG